MRRRLVHAYFEIDFNLLWTTVTDSLPALIAAFETERIGGLWAGHAAAGASGGGKAMVTDADQRGV